MNRFCVFVIAALTFVSVIAPARGADGWFTDFEEAKKNASETGRPILADFTGSDWCIWCKKLKAEVFAQSTFLDYAETNLVLLEIDFPRAKKLPPQLVEQNQQPMEHYGVMGFPTVLLLDSAGNVIAQTGYRQGGAKSYVAHLKELLQQAVTTNQ